MHCWIKMCFLLFYLRLCNIERTQVCHCGLLHHGLRCLYRRLRDPVNRLYWIHVRRTLPTGFTFPNLFIIKPFILIQTFAAYETFTGIHGRVNIHRSFTIARSHYCAAVRKLTVAQLLLYIETRAFEKIFVQIYLEPIDWFDFLIFDLLNRYWLP